MANLYIANASRQDHDFHFSLPDRKRANRVVIEQGKQIVIKGQAPEVISSIIEHHRLYGMREAKEALRSRSFSGLVYSEKEIKADGIAEAVEHNLIVLDELGRQLKKEAAVVADTAVQNSGPETSVLKGTDVEMVEMVGRDNPDTKINQKFRVEDKAGATDRRGKGRAG